MELLSLCSVKWNCQHRCVEDGLMMGDAIIKAMFMCMYASVHFFQTV